MYYFTCNVIWFTGRIIVFKRRGCIYYTFGVYHNKYVVIQTVRNCVMFEIAIAAFITPSDNLDCQTELYTNEIFYYIIN